MLLNWPWSQQVELALAQRARLGANFPPKLLNAAAAHAVQVEVALAAPRGRLSVRTAEAVLMTPLLMQIKAKLP